MTDTFATRFRNFIMLNTGEKINPEEIEEVYSKAAPVKAMCVFTVSGMHGVRKAKVLWAVIQPDLDTFREYSEVNLRAVLKERFDNAEQSLPSHKRLKGFTITLENLPHNLFAQLNRLAVKKIYEPRVIAGKEGTLSVSKELSPEDLLLTGSKTGIKVLECLKEQCGIRRPIVLADSLELDLGIDSLGRIELASGLEAAFKTKIKAEAIARSFKVKDLILEIINALSEDERIAPEEQEYSKGPDFWKEHLKVLPKKETLEMLDLGYGFFAWLFRFVLTAIDCLIFNLFFFIKAEGPENVPKEGAYIIYGNHTSFLDGPAIAACLPRRPMFQLFYFVFGPYFFRPFVKSRVLRTLIKAGRFIPFDYSTYFLEALRSCYFVLQKGRGLCFFPEGLRSTTGEIGEFRRGFGILAKETGAKLVPVAIVGAHEAWPSTAQYPKRHPIRVRFGKPLLVEDLEKEGRLIGAKDSYDAICVAARQALVDLKDKLVKQDNSR
jgi:long-chain acyl-CoA synthetase